MSSPPRPFRAVRSLATGGPKLVIRSGHRFWGRGLVVALIWVAASTLSAPPARASGCHAPDRPVLGLTFASERTDDVSPPSFESPGARAPSFVPVPCPGETPVSTPRDLPTPAAALPPILRHPEDPGRASWFSLDDRFT